MSVVVVTPPVPDIDLELVKSHLRVESDGDDTLIEAYVAAACSHIDGPQGWLGRAIWTQTLELRQNVFCGPIPLPYGPVESLTSIKYVDAAGVEQTLDSAVYSLLPPGVVGLTYGSAWPTLRGDAQGVRIRYVAGSDETPPAIRAAVLLMVGDLYANRETVGEVTGAVQMSTTVANLLSPFRNWRV
jgi:uncharacterized phiE125 gp8 family phage protein